MKYAVIAVAGAIGMGLSVLGASVGKYGSSANAEFFAIASFIIMLLGFIGTMGSNIRDWWKGEE